MTQTSQMILHDPSLIKLDPWVLAILPDPVSKFPVQINHFPHVNGIPDGRVFLKNTYGYNDWAENQTLYEEHVISDNNDATGYRKEIAYDRPIYERFLLNGRILDCGGGAGTVREFLAKEANFVSTDPWLDAPFASSNARKDAYKCLNNPLNFIGATAEFLPFITESFDWVHLRSMLDHVQVVDLALLEARRVLRLGGHVLIGMYVDGGKSGRISLERRVKDGFKSCLRMVGINRWKDHHIWHPTYAALTKVITDNGFTIEDTYWQPQWNNTVCYISAIKG